MSRRPSQGRYGGGALPRDRVRTSNHAEQGICRGDIGERASDIPQKEPQPQDVNARSRRSASLVYPQAACI
jgi:hypothetical protein